MVQVLEEKGKTKCKVNLRKSFFSASQRCKVSPYRHISTSTAPMSEK